MAAAAGVADRCEIRVADYRELDDGPYDKIASVGMVEHVGAGKLGEYASTLRSLLRPGGLLLNHGITRAAPRPWDDKSFVGRFVFPDGELESVDTIVRELEQAGLEVRDLESLREHYALTLRRWLANLAAAREEALAEAGEERERIWRLYMTGAARSFEHGDISVHQVLAAAPGGAPELPLIRPDLGGLEEDGNAQHVDSRRSRGSGDPVHRPDSDAVRGADRRVGKHDPPRAARPRLRDRDGPVCERLRLARRFLRPARVRVRALPAPLRARLRAVPAPRRDGRCRCPSGCAPCSSGSGRPSSRPGRCSRCGPDYVPLEYAEALRSLHDAVPPFPGAEAVRIVEAELGAPLARLFADFEHEPFAAASLSQVHRAVLPDGRRVAVKVQRPGIAEQVERDLALLAFLARRIERRRPEALAFRPSAAVAELAEYTRRELDFRREARTAERVRAHFAGDRSRSSSRRSTGSGRRRAC